MNNKTISRRNLLKTALAGTIVLGFDPIARLWITEASANPIIGIPPLDGVLLSDPDSLSAGSTDFGNIKRRQPIAILKPGSVNDIIRMVQYAREHKLHIAARGQGHTAFGQSLVEAGIQIDMGALVKAPVIKGDRVKASAGMVWRDLLRETLNYGLAPPVLTGYIGLSIGGTLSVGGIGNNSYRYGAQVDNVLELEVVTGMGKLEVCSATRKPELFNAALAGLGQCAIIINATLKLIPAQSQTRVFNLFYTDIHTMLDDERLLINDGRFDLVLGFVVPSPAPGGGWVMFIETVSYFTPPNEPINANLLAGLNFIPGSEQFTDLDYFTRAARVDDLVNFVKSEGRFNLSHPWLDIFVPDSKIDDYAGNILATLTPDDLGPDWPILFFPLKSKQFTKPFLRIPDQEGIFFLFDILRTAPDDATAAAMLVKNREFFEQARDLGSKHYKISAIPLSQQDWQEHFQPFWGDFIKAKHHFDPDNVLTPGPGIFGKNIR